MNKHHTIDFSKLDRLTDYEVSTLLSALRGPDKRISGVNDIVKSVTALPVRMFLYGEERACRISDPNYIMYEKFTTLTDKQIAGVGYHYLNHARLALRFLIDHSVLPDRTAMLLDIYGSIDNVLRSTAAWKK